jgi:hypothetical protein
VSNAGTPSGSQSSSPAAPIDTSNRYMVARGHDRLFIMRTPPPALSDDDALNLAAWLVAMVLEPDVDERFAAVLRAIRNT